MAAKNANGVGRNSTEAPSIEKIRVNEFLESVVQYLAQQVNCAIYCAIL